MESIKYAYRQQLLFHLIIRQFSTTKKTNSKITKQNNTLQNQKKFHESLLSFTINNKTHLLQLKEEFNKDSQLSEILDKINSYSIQKLLSLVNKSFYKIFLLNNQPKAKEQITNTQLQLIKSFSQLLANHSKQLNYIDSISQIRLYKTLDLEQGNKKLINKLQANILDELMKQISIENQNIEKVKEIFKVPCIELHLQTISIINKNFDSIDKLFHFQFFLLLAKEFKVMENIKHPLSLEIQSQIMIKDYIEKIFQNKDIVELIYASQKSHKMKYLFMLSKFKTSSSDKQKEIMNHLQKDLVSESHQEKLKLQILRDVSLIMFKLKQSIFEKNITNDMEQYSRSVFQNIEEQDLFQLDDNHLNMFIKVLPQEQQYINQWKLIMQIQTQRIKQSLFNNDSALIISNLSLNTLEDLQFKFFIALKEKFIEQKKEMELLDKIDLSNIIIKQSQNYKNLISNKFLETLYYHLIKDNQSFYFLKCVNIIHTLKMLSQIKMVKYNKEFWFKTEDMIMRRKRDFSLEQIVEIIELFSHMHRGSQIFWQEIEDYLIINNSSFKQQPIELTYRVILGMGKVGRTHETFWKIYSQLYEQIYDKLTFDQKVYIMDVFAKINTKMHIVIYQKFARDNLPKPNTNNQDFKLKDDINFAIALSNILDKFGSARVSQKDLFDLIQDYFQQKLTTTNELDNKDLLIKCIQAIIKNGSSELKQLLHNKLDQIIEKIEDKKEQECLLQIKNELNKVVVSTNQQ